AGNHPPKARPRMIAGNACSVGAGTDRNAHTEHFLERRSSLGRFNSVASDVVLPLIRHAMLDGDPTAKALDALKVGVGNRLGMIDKPAKLVDWHVAVHALEDV